MSALCHERTHAAQQNEPLFDHFVGAILEQNEVGRQRARYMTLETIAPLGDDPTVSFPTIVS